MPDPRIPRSKKNQRVWDEGWVQTNSYLYHFCKSNHYWSLAFRHCHLCVEVLSIKRIKITKIKGPTKRKVNFVQENNHNLHPDPGSGSGSVHPCYLVFAVWNCSAVRCLFGIIIFWFLLFDPTLSLSTNWAAPFIKIIMKKTSLTPSIHLSTCSPQPPDSFLSYSFFCFLWYTRKKVVYLLFLFLLLVKA